MKKLAVCKCNFKNLEIFQSSIPRSLRWLAHKQWRHQGGGHGGANAPQLEALPPHLPPQSEWDFFFFFFFTFFFFFFFFTYVVSHTSHQFKINISIFCNISFYK